jgi:hypothetical protein
MRLSSIIAGLLGLTLGAWLITSNAEAYRWTDANGVVHFSQFPPPNQQKNAKKVSDTPISTLSGAGSTTSAKDSGTAPAAAAANSAPQPIKKQVMPASKQACDTARTNLAALKSGQRIKVQMPDGSTHWLAGAERAKRLKQTQDFLAQRCK